MIDNARPLAVVTGASTGIGYELAACCARDGFDLVIAADEAEIDSAAARLRDLNTEITSVRADLSTMDGVAQLYGAIAGRKVDVLCANAGIGLGNGFLEQDFAAVRRVIDTNITGTLALLQQVGRDMRRHGAGRILITGSIAGFLPGTFQAVYNGTKAFLDSFSVALRHELKETGVSVTCLMPGATDTRFFERAGMMDTQVGTAKKDSAAKVAQDGFDAMMKGSEGVVSGLKNKIQAAVAHVAPAAMTAEMHSRMAKPGTAKR